MAEANPLQNAWMLRCPIHATHDCSFLERFQGITTSTKFRSEALSRDRWRRRAGEVPCRQVSDGDLDRWSCARDARGSTAVAPVPFVYVRYHEYGFPLCGESTTFASPYDLHWISSTPYLAFVIERLIMIPSFGIGAILNQSERHNRLSLFLGHVH